MRTNDASLPFTSTERHGWSQPTQNSRIEHTAEQCLRTRNVRILSADEICPFAPLGLMGSECTSRNITRYDPSLIASEFLDGVNLNAGNERIRRVICERA